MFQVLIPILIFLIVLYVLWNQKYGRSELNLPPGSFGWPLLGESLSLLQAGWDGVPERFFQERIQKYGSPLVFKTSLFGERVAVMCSPAGNKFLFGSENQLVGLWWPWPVRKLMGTCLITSRGDEAKWIRKMLLSYLGRDAFSRRYAITMDVITRRHIENHWQGKAEINVHKTVQLYIFEVACHLFLSLEEPNLIEKLCSLFRVFVKVVIGLPIDVPGTRFYKSRKAGDAIRIELMKLIKERRRSLELGKASSSQDLLSHLLTSSDESGRYLTETEITNNIVMLLTAGQDTSTVAITMLIKRLGEHPDVYEKVLKEHLEISRAKKQGELLNWDDIKKMEYTWNVVLEVMRITQPVTGTFREALVDIEYAGYTIPKGWKLHWSASSTHKDEGNFQDATEFDPSRFESMLPTPYSYVPFGGGLRMCIGKEFARLNILVFLHNIVINYKWDLLIPNEKITFDPGATPEKGLPIRLYTHQV